MEDAAVEHLNEAIASLVMMLVSWYLAGTEF